MQEDSTQQEQAQEAAMSAGGVTMAGAIADSGGQSNLVTVTEATARLGRTERTIRRMIASGRLGTVTLHGKLYVQLAGADTQQDTAGGSVTLAGKAQDKTDELRERLEAQLRDTIKHLEAENARLWGMVTSMLPAGKDNPSRQARPVWAAAAWTLLGGAVLMALGLGVYWLWLTR